MQMPQSLPLLKQCALIRPFGVSVKIWGAVASSNNTWGWSRNLGVIG
jgi:hypothetical protein